MDQWLATPQGQQWAADEETAGAAERQRNEARQQANSLNRLYRDQNPGTTLSDNEIQDRYIKRYGTRELSNRGYQSYAFDWEQSNPEVRGLKEHVDLAQSQQLERDLGYHTTWEDMPEGFQPSRWQRRKNDWTIAKNRMAASWEAMGAFGADALGFEDMGRAWALEAKHDMEQADALRGQGNVLTRYGGRDFEGFTDYWEYGTGTIFELLPFIGETVGMSAAFSAAGAAIIPAPDPLDAITIPGGAIIGAATSIVARSTARKVLQRQVARILGEKGISTATRAELKALAANYTDDALLALSDDTLRLLGDDALLTAVSASKGTVHSGARSLLLRKVERLGLRPAAGLNAESAFALQWKVQMKTYGAMTGTFVNTSIVEGGGTMMDYAQWAGIGPNDIEFGKGLGMIGMGMVSGAAETLPTLMIANRIFARPVKAAIAKSVKDKLWDGTKAFTKDTGKFMGAEALTEVFQETTNLSSLKMAQGIGIGLPYLNVGEFSSEEWDHIKEAGVKGAIGGAFFGNALTGLGKAIHKIKADPGKTISDRLVQRGADKNAEIQKVLSDDFVVADDKPEEGETVPVTAAREPSSDQKLAIGALAGKEAAGEISEKDADAERQRLVVDEQDRAYYQKVLAAKKSAIQMDRKRKIDQLALDEILSTGSEEDKASFDARRKELVRKGNKADRDIYNRARAKYAEMQSKGMVGFNEGDRDLEEMSFADRRAAYSLMGVEIATKTEAGMSLEEIKAEARTQAERDLIDEIIKFESADTDLQDDLLDLTLPNIAVSPKQEGLARYIWKMHTGVAEEHQVNFEEAAKTSKDNTRSNAAWMSHVDEVIMKWFSRGADEILPSDIDEHQLEPGETSLTVEQSQFANSALQSLASEGIDPASITKAMVIKRTKELIDSEKKVLKDHLEQVAKNNPTVKKAAAAVETAPAATEESKAKAKELEEAKEEAKKSVEKAVAAKVKKDRRREVISKLIKEAQEEKDPHKKINLLFKANGLRIKTDGINFSKEDRKAYAKMLKALKADGYTWTGQAGNNQGGESKLVGEQHHDGANVLLDSAAAATAEDEHLRIHQNKEHSVYKAVNEPRINKDGKQVQPPKVDIVLFSEAAEIAPEATEEEVAPEAPVEEMKVDKESAEQLIAKIEEDIAQLTRAQDTREKEGMTIDDRPAVPEAIVQATWAHIQGLRDDIQSIRDGKVPVKYLQDKPSNLKTPEEAEAEGFVKLRGQREAEEAVESFTDYSARLQREAEEAAPEVEEVAEEEVVEEAAPEVEVEIEGEVGVDFLYDVKGNRVPIEVIGRSKQGTVRYRTEDGVEGLSSEPWTAANPLSMEDVTSPDFEIAVVGRPKVSTFSTQELEDMLEDRKQKLEGTKHLWGKEAAPLDQLKHVNSIKSELKRRKQAEAEAAPEAEEVARPAIPQEKDFENYETYHEALGRWREESSALGQAEEAKEASEKRVEAVNARAAAGVSSDDAVHGTGVNEAIKILKSKKVKAGSHFNIGIEGQFADYGVHLFYGSMQVKGKSLEKDYRKGEFVPAQDIKGTPKAIIIDPTADFSDADFESLSELKALAKSKNIPVIEMGKAPLAEEVAEEEVVEKSKDLQEAEEELAEAKDELADKEIDLEDAYEKQDKAQEAAKKAERSAERKKKREAKKAKDAPKKVEEAPVPSSYAWAIPEALDQGALIQPPGTQRKTLRALQTEKDKLERKVKTKKFAKLKSEEREAVHKELAAVEKQLDDTERQHKELEKLLFGKKVLADVIDDETGEIILSYASKSNKNNSQLRVRKLMRTRTIQFADTKPADEAEVKELRSKIVEILNPMPSVQEKKKARAAAEAPAEILEYNLTKMRYEELVGHYGESMLFTETDLFSIALVKAKGKYLLRGSAKDIATLIANIEDDYTGDDPIFAARDNPKLARSMMSLAKRLNEVIEGTEAEDKAPAAVAPEEAEVHDRIDSLQKQIKELQSMEENPISLIAALEATVNAQSKAIKLNRKDKDKLIIAFSKAVEEVGLRTTYGERTEAAKSPSYRLVWSNSDAMWFVSRKIKKGETVKLDANMILVEANNKHKAQAIAANLPQLPLHEFSTEMVMKGGIENWVKGLAARVSPNSTQHKQLESLLGEGILSEEKQDSTDAVLGFINFVDPPSSKKAAEGTEAEDETLLAPSWGVSKEEVAKHLALAQKIAGQLRSDGLIGEDYEAISMGVADREVGPHTFSPEKEFTRVLTLFLATRDAAGYAHAVSLVGDNVNRNKAEERGEVYKRDKLLGHQFALEAGQPVLNDYLGKEGIILPDYELIPEVQSGRRAHFVEREVAPEETPPAPEVKSPEAVALEEANAELEAAQKAQEAALDGVADLEVEVENMAEEEKKAAEEAVTEPQVVEKKVVPEVAKGNINIVETTPERMELLSSQTSDKLAKEWETKSIHMTTPENLAAIASEGLLPQVPLGQIEELKKSPIPKEMWPKMLYFVGPHSMEKWNKGLKGDITHIVATTGGIGLRLEGEFSTEEEHDRYMDRRKKGFVILGFNAPVYNTQDKGMAPLLGEKNAELSRMTDVPVPAKDISVWTDNGWVPIAEYVEGKNLGVVAEGVLENEQEEAKEAEKEEEAKEPKPKRKRKPRKPLTEAEKKEKKKGDLQKIIDEFQITAADIEASQELTPEETRNFGEEVASIAETQEEVGDEGNLSGEELAERFAAMLTAAKEEEAALESEEVPEAAVLSGEELAKRFAAMLEAMGEDTEMSAEELQEFASSTVTAGADPSTLSRTEFVNTAKAYSKRRKAAERERPMLTEFWKNQPEEVQKFRTDFMRAQLYGSEGLKGTLYTDQDGQVFFLPEEVDNVADEYMNRPNDFTLLHSEDQTPNKFIGEFTNRLRKQYIFPEPGEYTHLSDFMIFGSKDIPSVDPDTGQGTSYRPKDSPGVKRARARKRGVKDKPESQEVPNHATKDRELTNEQIREINETIIDDASDNFQGVNVKTKGKVGLLALQMGGAIAHHVTHLDHGSGGLDAIASFYGMPTHMIAEANNIEATENEYGNMVFEVLPGNTITIPMPPVAWWDMSEHYSNTLTGFVASSGAVDKTIGRRGAFIQDTDTGRIHLVSVQVTGQNNVVFEDPGLDKKGKLLRARKIDASEPGFLRPEVHSPETGVLEDPALALEHIKGTNRYDLLSLVRLRHKTQMVGNTVPSLTHGDYNFLMGLIDQKARRELQGRSKVPQGKGTTGYYDLTRAVPMTYFEDIASDGRLEIDRGDPNSNPDLSISENASEVTSENWDVISIIPTLGLEQDVISTQFLKDLFYSMRRQKIHEGVSHPGYKGKKNRTLQSMTRDEVEREVDYFYTTHPTGQAAFNGHIREIFESRVKAIYREGRKLGKSDAELYEEAEAALPNARPRTKEHWGHLMEVIKPVMTDHVYRRLDKRGDTTIQLFTTSYEKILKAQGNYEFTSRGISVSAERAIKQNQYRETQRQLAKERVKALEAAGREEIVITGVSKEVSDILEAQYQVLLLPLKLEEGNLIGSPRALQILADKLETDNRRGDPRLGDKAKTFRLFVESIWGWDILLQKPMGMGIYSAHQQFVLDNTESADGLRFSPIVSEESPFGYMSDDAVSQKFLALRNVAAQYGLPVHLMSSDAEYGQINLRPDGNVIAIAMADIFNPNPENLDNLLEEIAHHVFDELNLDTSQKRAFLAKITEVSQRSLNERYRAQLENMTPDEVSDLLKEEQLIREILDEVAADKSLDGLTEQEAKRGIVDFFKALIQYIKDALDRVIIKVQGKNVDPRTARRFLKRRLISFISGRPMSGGIMQAMGLRMPENRSAGLTQVNPNTPSVRYDSFTGQYIYAPVLPDSPEAVVHNILYSNRPQMSSDILDVLASMEGLNFLELPPAEQQKYKDAAWADLQSFFTDRNTGKIDGLPRSNVDGVPSKLSGTDWALARTELFRRWAGEWAASPGEANVLMDEDTGEPLKVWHVTPAEQADRGEKTTARGTTDEDSKYRLPFTEIQEYSYVTGDKLYAEHINDLKNKSPRSPFYTGKKEDISQEYEREAGEKAGREFWAEATGTAIDEKASTELRLATDRRPTEEELIKGREGLREEGRPIFLGGFVRAEKVLDLAGEGSGAIRTSVQLRVTPAELIPFLEKNGVDMSGYSLEAEFGGAREARAQSALPIWEFFMASVHSNARLEAGVAAGALESKPLRLLDVIKNSGFDVIKFVEGTPERMATSYLLLKGGNQFKATTMQDWRNHVIQKPNFAFSTSTDFRFSGVRTPGAETPSSDVIQEHIAAIDIAANNFMLEKIVDEVWNNVPAAQKLYDTKDDMAKAYITNIQKAVETTKLVGGTADPNYKLDSLLTEAADNAAMAAMGMLDKLATKTSNDTYKADKDINRKTASMTRKMQKFNDLNRNYLDLDWQFSEMWRDFKESIDELKKDAMLAKRLGMTAPDLSQLLGKLEDQYNTPVARNELTLLNAVLKKNYGRTFGSFNRLVDELSAFDDEIAFGVLDTDIDPSAAKDRVSQALQDRRADLKNNPVLADIVAAFMIKNSMHVLLLQVRKMSVEQGRDAIMDVLKTTLAGLPVDIAQVSRKANIQGRAKTRLVRLHEKVKKAKQEQGRLIKEVENLQNKIDYGNEASFIYSQARIELERRVGERRQFFLHNGAVLHIPPSPNADPLFMKDKDNDVVYYPATYDQHEEHLEKMTAWLESQPEWSRGTAYHLVQTQVDALRHVFIRDTLDLDTHYGGQFNLGAYWFRTARWIPITKRARLTGLHEMIDLAQMFNEHAAHLQRAQDLAKYGEAFVTASISGVEGEKAAGMGAMRAMEIEDYGSNISQDYFFNVFYDQALKHIEDNKEQLHNLSDEDAIEKGIKMLKKHYTEHKDSETKKKANMAWPALERFYRATVTANMKLREFVNELHEGALVEEDVAGNKIYRSMIGNPWTVSRGFNASAAATIGNMSSLWNSTDSPFRSDSDFSFEDAHESNPDKLREEMDKYFHDQGWTEVIEKFVKPILEKDGKSLFKAPLIEADGGFRRQATRAEIDQAWNGSDDDVVNFAERLWATTTEGIDQDQIETSQSKFVSEVLTVFKSFFNNMNTAFQESNESWTDMAAPRDLLDARETEDYPSEFMEFNRLDHLRLRAIANRASMHSAFGRDFNRVQTLWLQAKGRADGINQLRKELELKQLDTGSNLLTQRKMADLLEEARRTNPVYKDITLNKLNNIKRIVEDLDAIKRDFNGFAKLSSGRTLDDTMWLELIGAVAGNAVQGLKTIVNDTSAPVFNPIRNMGVNGLMFMTEVSTMKSALAQTFNTFMNAFGQEFRFNIEFREIANKYKAVDGTGREVWNNVIMGMNSAQSNLEIGSAEYFKPMPEGTEKVKKFFIKFARLLSAHKQMGLGQHKEGEMEAPGDVVLRPTGPFGTAAHIMQLSAAHGMLDTTAYVLLKAAEYYAENPGYKGDITKDMLGGWEGVAQEKALDFIRENVALHGGMQIDRFARKLGKQIRETGKVEPFINSELATHMYVLAQTSVTGEATAGTRPPAFITSMAGRAINPLLGWAVNQSYLSGFEQFREADMTRKKGFWRKAKYFAIPLLAGVGATMVYSLLRDELEERVIGVKQRGIKPYSFGGALDAIDRVGMFGALGSVANEFVNRESSKSLEIENRILFISTIKQIWNLGERQWRSEGDLTWAGLGRPVAQIMGMGGYLQYGQILNNTFSLDNAEARYNARLNANNAIVSAGKTLNMEFKGSFFGTGTAITPHVKQMEIAAMANDSEAFRNAKQDAIAAAMVHRGENEQEATKHIIEKFQGGHPFLRNFKSRPTKKQIEQIYSAMSDLSRKDVEEAVRLYDHYIEQLGKVPFRGKGESKRPPRRPQRPDPFDFEPKRGSRRGGRDVDKELLDTLRGR